MNPIIDPEVIKAFLNGDWDMREKRQLTSAAAEETDLHYEKISRQTGAIPAGEILGNQLDLLDKEIDNALAHGVNPFTIIVGKGKAKLMKETIRRLKKHPLVKDHTALEGKVVVYFK